MQSTPSRKLVPSLKLGLKRLFDISVASLAIVALSPMLLATSVLLRMTQGSPVIYRGVRTGLDGKPFYILKFRTMVNRAEQIGGTTTGKNDPRLTRIGALLRRYKLDELPQFFNVLKGDMSIVGPRPEVSEYTEQYAGDELRILSMKPGITDLASIEFNDLQEVVGEENPDEYYSLHVLPRKNQLRLRYVDEWSLKNDAAILARTAYVVASKPFRRSA
ncbi:sugar transferase [Aeoliella mucimassa]|uniref:Putative sugar transferase EpsL n=1 Tax=Aeoliella mucimassa TaxID=2527972 RepID=A0A518AKT9_9BACT|nr:sugar transferase [Aeoliella mucimassa]QDU55349.1 putative sugar transferase EpsL [Aeoliella mucimassa]